MTMRDVNSTVKRGQVSGAMSGALLSMRVCAPFCYYWRARI